MTELHPINVVKVPKAHVIFVHGIGGDPFTTWSHDAAAQENLWPLWLAQELENIAVYTLEYDASPSAWVGGRMPLSERAPNVLTELQTRNLSSAPIIFICHSLGGLLVKQILRHAMDMQVDAWNAIANQTKAVIFIATPHRGSSFLASVSNILRFCSPIRLMMRPSRLLKELERNLPALYELNSWYIHNAERIGVRTYCFYETKPYNGILLVDESSACLDIPGTSSIAIDADHFQICKPKSSRDLICRRIHQIVQLTPANSRDINQGAPSLLTRRSAEPAAEVIRIQAGGTLDPKRHVYIERPEDARVLGLLLDHQFVNIISPRQMGKSSLMIRVLQELESSGVRAVHIDMSTLVEFSADADVFYTEFLTKIGFELKLPIRVEEWWKAHASKSTNRRLIEFFQSVVLDNVDGPIVIFIDEIDSTLPLPYTDSLFATIRGMYNQRPLISVFSRLTFCLLGVASPNDLIKDPRTTPYNVGTTLELGDFSADRDDLSVLRAHLGPLSDRLLPRILYWTGGHPYLTMKLCSELAHDERGATKVDEYVKFHFSEIESIARDQNISWIDTFLRADVEQTSAALNLYSRILSGEREPDRQTVAHLRLKLSGLVKRDSIGCLVVRNEIYRQMFNLSWVNSHLPGARDRDRLVQKGVLVTDAADSGGLRIQFRPETTHEDIETVFQDLSKGDVITELVLEQTGLHDLTCLSGMYALESLNVAWTRIIDLRPIRLLRKLAALDLNQTGISDITALGGLSALRKLNLSRTRINDLEPLAALKSLRELDIQDVRSVSRITPLSALGSLEWLNLSRTQVSDLSPLSNLNGLRRLDLSETRVRDLTPLAGLSALRFLSLSRL